jgi:hypothetical protein
MTKNSSSSSSSTAGRTKGDAKKDRSRRSTSAIAMAITHLPRPSPQRFDLDDAIKTALLQILERVGGAHQAGINQMLRLTEQAVHHLIRGRQKAARRSALDEEKAILRDLLNSAKTMLDLWARLMANSQLKGAVERRIFAKLTGSTGRTQRLKEMYRDLTPDQVIQFAAVFREMKLKKGAEYLDKTDRELTNWLNVAVALIAPFVKTLEATKRTKNFPDYLFVDVLAFHWWKFLGELPTYTSQEGGEEAEDSRSAFHKFVQSTGLYPAIADEIIRGAVERSHLYEGSSATKKTVRRSL